MVSTALGILQNCSSLIIVQCSICGPDIVAELDCKMKLVPLADCFRCVFGAKERGFEQEAVFRRLVLMDCAKMDRGIVVCKPRFAALADWIIRFSFNW